LSSAPRSRAGGASGMLGTARLSGQTLGAALVALIFGVVPHHAPFVVLCVAAGFSAVAAVVSTLRVTQTAPSGLT
jgi:MFS transporter, DHA2 family, multidrug resistance protein